MEKKDKVRQNLIEMSVLEGVLPTRSGADREMRQAWAGVGRQIVEGEMQAAASRSRDLLDIALSHSMVEDSAIGMLTGSEELRQQVAGFARAGFGFFHGSREFLELPPERRRGAGGNDAVTRVMVDGTRLLLETSRLIVQFAGELDAGERAEILRRHGLFALESDAWLPGLMRVACHADAAREASLALMEEAAVVYSEPDFIEHIGLRHVPHDPDYYRQWHHPRILADAAWDISRGNGIHVAVIDNGFDVHHSDLAFGSLSGWYRPTTDLADADFVRGIAGMPGDDHGTACAGMIAAREGNGVGGCGIAFDSQLSAIACMPDQIGTQSTLARALAFAARPDLEGLNDQRGADIICCSLGPNGAVWRIRQVLADAIDFVSGAGRQGRGAALFWASTNGNFPINADEVCSHPQVIAVGRSKDSDEDDGSGFGPELDFLAPGVSVWLPGQGDTHHATTGTSFAAPAAAAVGALALSMNPTLTAVELREILRGSCDKIGPLAYIDGRNPRYGFGRVNALRALRAVP